MSRIKDIIVSLYATRDMKKPLMILTHSGIFHADELIALAIIKLYVGLMGIKIDIQRSRDELLFDVADIILDEGALNEGKYFDHHQDDFAETRRNGLPLATAGLVWRDLGRELLWAMIRQNFTFDDISQGFIERAWEKVDERLITHIDCSDNGINIYKGCIARPVDLVSIVTMFNDYSYQSNSQEEQFKRALRYVTTVVHSFICSIISQTYDEHALLTKVVPLLENRESDILYADRHYHAWKDVVMSDPEIFAQYKLIVYPTGEEAKAYRQGETDTATWRITSLPITDEEDVNTSRCPAPLAWRGLDEQDLKRITGHRGIIFIHKSGSMGGLYGKKKDALALARAWIDHDLEEDYK